MRGKLLRYTQAKVQSAAARLDQRARSPSEAIPEDFDGLGVQMGCHRLGLGGRACPISASLEVNDIDFGDAPYHGKDGPLPVYRAPIDQWGTVDRALR